MSGLTDDTPDAEEIENRLIFGSVLGAVVATMYGLVIYPALFGSGALIPMMGMPILVQGWIFVFSSFVVFYTGWPLIEGAVESYRQRRPDRHMVVGTAVALGYTYSTYSVYTADTLYIPFDLVVFTTLLGLFVLHYKPLHDDIPVVSHLRNRWRG